MIEMRNDGMGKKYAGNVPGPNEGWEHVGTCRDADGIEWLVLSKSQKHTQDWCTYKIVANGRAANKANYWLTGNKLTGRIGFSRDYVCMRETRPELYAQVETIIKWGGTRAEKTCHPKDGHGTKNGVEADLPRNGGGHGNGG
jgi:hypothetical protein